MSSAAIGSGTSSVPQQPAPGQGQAQESALWAVLAGASGAEEFCQSWLAIQCRLIPGVTGGVVLLQAGSDSRYMPVAVWPDVRKDMSYLTQVAQRSLMERRGLVQPAAGDGGGYHVAYPVEALGTLHGVVVIDVATRPESELQGVLRQLHWGAASLELLFYRGAVAKEVESRNRLQTVLELVASAAGQERYTASAMSLVTELATRLECDRVSLGFVQAGQIKIDAFSHSAQFKERTNLVRAVAAAMDEAVDQGAPITWPPVAGALPVVSRAHEALSKEQGGGTVCTIPMQVGNAFVGALTLERLAGKPFDEPALELLEALTGLAGPILDTHRREDQWFGKRALIWWKEKLRQLFGPRHAALKFGVLAAALVLAFMTLAKGPFRVSAGTSLEPLVQQAAAAPFNGYVREAPVRAGDLVKAGTLLARLDDRELKLERLKWLSQEEELGKQFRQAMADRNAAQVQIVTAQLDQAKAQVARVEDQLSRTTIVAPFDGVVVSGDLSQQLGAPVERGTVLFEVAPLESFRLVVKVDERDVAYVREGQRGSLLLSAFPDETIGFTVKSVTPVSTPRDGRNFFRVEAQLDRTDPRMRPNMEGVGKVEIDERRYIWIWTRSVIDSLRLMLWQWLP
jgi:RND family efflux transporter MFP subunit